MVAVDLGLCTLVHLGYKDCHLVFHSDNHGIVGALAGGRSHGSIQSEILCHIVSNFCEHKIWLSFVWVKSVDNESDSIS